MRAQSCVCTNATPTYLFQQWAGHPLPFLKKLFADSAYAGPVFQDGLANVMPSLVTEIVRRCDQAKGFVVLPKRWIVERTIAWLGRCRRLAKDWENRNHSALAFLRLASIRLMVTGAKPRAGWMNGLAAAADEVGKRGMIG